VWVTGPDGRRELDVHVVETGDGRTIHGVIECKDFNPTTTGPVGIGYVDALESKRRDLPLDWVMMCSNAGFTSEATNKAKRVGIGLIGAARMGDDRIRFRVVDDIYIRHIRINECRLRFWPAPGAAPMPDSLLPLDVFMFKGRPIANWFFVRFVEVLATNPIVNGTFNDYCRLTTPITINWPDGETQVERIGFEISIEGAWFVQTVQLDSTSAIYDWLRRRMRMHPGSPGEQRQLQIVGVDYFAGQWIRRPPDVELADGKLLQHDVSMKFIVLKNLIPLDDPPALTPHVVPEDLNTKLLDEPPPGTIDSLVGFKPDRVEREGRVEASHAPPIKPVQT
jgi:hypothetical protein